VVARVLGMALFGGVRGVGGVGFSAGGGHRLARCVGAAREAWAIRAGTDLSNPEVRSRAERSLAERERSAASPLRERVAPPLSRWRPLIQNCVQVANR